LPCKIPGDENGPFRAIFIRAPAILSAGPAVEVLAEYVLPAEKAAQMAVEKIIVAVKEGNLMATSFHPEITADTRWGHGIHRFVS
jgi:5'-phosphate synthase pdxT subunit